MEYAEFAPMGVVIDMDASVVNPNWMGLGHPIVGIYPAEVDGNLSYRVIDDITLGHVKWISQVCRSWVSSQRITVEEEAEVLRNLFPTHLCTWSKSQS